VSVGDEDGRGINICRVVRIDFIPWMGKIYHELATLFIKVLKTFIKKNHELSIVLWKLWEKID